MTADSNKFFNFPTINEMVEKFDKEPTFKTAVQAVFETVNTAEEFRMLLSKGFHETNTDVFTKISDLLDAPASLQGFTIPKTGIQATLLATFCREGDLVGIQRVGGGGILYVTQQENSPACLEGAEPVAANTTWSGDMVIEVYREVEFNGQVWAEDPAGFNPGSFTVYEQPLNAQIVYDSTDGRFVYIPAPGFIGSDSFTIRSINRNGEVSFQVVTVTVSEGG